MANCTPIASDANTVYSVCHHTVGHEDPLSVAIAVVVVVLILGFLALRWRRN